MGYFGHNKSEDQKIYKLRSWINTVMEGRENYGNSIFIKKKKNEARERKKAERDGSSKSLWVIIQTY